MTGEGPCGRCGVDPALGHAQIDQTWYCHDSLSDGPTCYMLASWERSGADGPTVSLIRWLTVLEGSRQEVIDRINAGWRYRKPNGYVVGGYGGHGRLTRTVERGVWFMIITEHVDGPRTFVRADPMTPEQQIAVYGEVVRESEK